MKTLITSIALLLSVSIATCEEFDYDNLTYTDYRSFDYYRFTSRLMAEQQMMEFRKVELQGSLDIYLYYWILGRQSGLMEAELIAEGCLIHE